MTLPKRPPSSRRHHRLPPPLLEGASERDGYALLEEHPEALALVLMKTSRSTRLMAAGGTTSADLFAADSIGRRLRLIRECGAGSDLRAALTTAAESLVSPERGRLQRALLDIAEWGVRSGATATALEFFQLAALMDDRSAAPCREAGKLARARGDLPRAELWFRHGIHRGRTAGDWPSATWSMIGLGVVMRLRGSLPAAETWLVRALRRGRRHGLRDVVAAAYHEMVVVAIRRESNRAVVRYGREAIQAYRGDARALAVAHDIAAFWMVQGFHAEALEVFRSIPNDFGTPSDRLALAANVARCAGARRLRSEFDQAVTRAEALLDSADSREMEGLALGAMAHGAAALGDGRQAIEFATRAVLIARQRGEAQLEVEMESLLARLRQTVDAGAAPGADPPARAPRPVSVLAREISAAIAV